MARLTDKKREDIKNALLLGDSQYKVAQDFEISSATVNKIFKEIDENVMNKTKSLVKEQIAIKTILSEQSESFSERFSDKVNEQLRRQKLVFNASEKIIVKATKMIDTIESATDLKALSDTVDKTSITLGVNERHAKTNITAESTISQTSNNMEIIFR